MIMTVKDADKPEAVGVAKRFEALGLQDLCHQKYCKISAGARRKCTSRQ